MNEFYEAVSNLFEELHVTPEKEILQYSRKNGKKQRRI